MASHNMDDLPNRKEKFKAAFTTILAECDKGIRSLQDDTKAVSKFTISKVKDIREKRRQRQPAPPGIAELLSDVNPGAGSEVLSHFKFQWGAIHQEAMGTSDMLDSVHMSLQKIFQSVNNSYKIILLAHDELAGLPNILKSLEDTNVKVESIEQMMRSTEEGIMEYMRVAKELEHERKKHSLKIQYEKYQEEKENEIKKWEAAVANEKLLTIEKQEQLELATKRERQEALENMFQQQMAEYRESGEVEKPILSEEAAKERSLSEVSVEVIDIKDEDGDKALDAFLGDVPDETSGSKDITSNRDIQGTEQEED